jgi:hypothetical protein
MLLYSSRKPAECTPPIEDPPKHSFKKRMTNGGSFNENHRNIDGEEDEGEVQEDSPEVDQKGVSQIPETKSKSRERRLLVNPSIQWGALLTHQ